MQVGINDGVSGFCGLDLLCRGSFVIPWISEARSRGECGMCWRREGRVLTGVERMEVEVG